MNLMYDPICSNCNARNGMHYSSGRCVPGNGPSLHFVNSGKNRTKQGLDYDPPVPPAMPAPVPPPAFIPWYPPAPPAMPSAQVCPLSIGDRVVRLTYGVQGIPAGRHGTVTHLDRLGCRISIHWDQGDTNNYGWGDIGRAFERIDDRAPTSANTAKCDTCSSPNAFDAVGNQPNGAFRCGQCRALRQVFG